METNFLKNRILGQVGYVDFPETVIENTIVMLQQPHRPAIYAQKLLRHIGDLHNPEYIAEARERKYPSICHLVRQLLLYYAYEDIDCLILHQYFRALSHDLETNICWYETNTGKVFEVKPSAELQSAEIRLWQYFEGNAPDSLNKIRLRHLLNSLFLFYDYVSNREALQTFLDRLEKQQLNLQIL